MRSTSVEQVAAKCSFVSAVSAPSRTTQSLRTSGLGCGSHAWGPAVVVAARFLQSCRRVAGTCRRQRNTGSCAISQTRAEELCDESGDLAGDLGQRLTTDRQKPTFPEAQKLHVCLLKQGFVRLAGFASPEDASAVRELYWAAEAQRSGICPEDSSSWPKGRGQASQRSGRGVLRLTSLPELDESPVFRRIAEDLQEALCEMFQCPLWRVARGRKIVSLLNFPSGAADLSEWDIPHDDWHTDSNTDSSITPSDPTQLFAFLYPERVAPACGGTVMMEGSVCRAQKLVRDEESEGTAATGFGKGLKLALATDPWAHALFSQGRPDERAAHFMGEGGEGLRVVELIGSAGDLVLWDPRCLHAVAANAGSRPRPLIRLSMHRTK
ncbi:unnamed protein product, partial [Polarella glacialis]